MKTLMQTGLVLLVAATLAHAEDARVTFRAESLSYFSSLETVDQIVASTAGSTCEDANLTITISTDAEEIIFEHKIPLSRLIPCSVALHDPREAERGWADISSLRKLQLHGFCALPVVRPAEGRA